MNKLLILLLSFGIVSNSYASCKWSEGVKPNDKDFNYSRDCHVKVGKSLEELDIRREQVGKLNKAIEFKDLALTESDKRVDNYKQGMEQVHKKFQQSQRLNKYENIFYFVLGAAVMGGAIYAGRQINK